MCVFSTFLSITIRRLKQASIFNIFFKINLKDLKYIFTSENMFLLCTILMNYHNWINKIINKYVLFIIYHVKTFLSILVITNIK